MSIRPLLCLLLAATAAVPLASAQALEVGALFGGLGAGVSIRTQVSDAWSVRVHGSYRSSRSTFALGSGSLRFHADEQTVRGAVGVSVDRRLVAVGGVTAGIWALVARKEQVIVAQSAAVLGEVLETEELGLIRTESRLPERPVPYAGLHLAERFDRRWALRLDVGVLLTGRTRRSESATGRLVATGLRSESAGSRLVPLVQLGITRQFHAPRD